MRCNLKDIRKNSKMSQEDLAEKCGINRTTISAIENGNTNCNFGTLCKIADALGVDVDALFSFDKC